MTYDHAYVLSMFFLNLCTDMVNTWLTFIEQAQRNREDAKSFVLEEASLMEVKVRNFVIVPSRLFKQNFFV